MAKPRNLSLEGIQRPHRPHSSRIDAALTKQSLTISIVSITRLRFRPFTLFRASNPRIPLFPSFLPTGYLQSQCLARGPARLPAGLCGERNHGGGPASCRDASAGTGMNGGVGREVARQVSPLVPGAEHVENGIHDLPAVCGRRPPSRLRGKYRSDLFPLRIGQVRRISASHRFMPRRRSMEGRPAR